MISSHFVNAKVTTKKFKVLCLNTYVMFYQNIGNKCDQRNKNNWISTYSFNQLIKNILIKNALHRINFKMYPKTK